MTCLNNSICPVNSTYTYFKFCDYIDNNYQYYPNLDITCSRENIRDYFSSDCTNCHLLVDCCYSVSEDECCGTKSLPPTSAPTIDPCNLTCKTSFRFDSCYFFENPKPDISCTDNDGQFLCCDNERSKCCVNDPYIVYGTAASIALVLLFLIFQLISGHNKKVVVHKNQVRVKPSQV